jgi:hypothetical protein
MFTLGESLDCADPEKQSPKNCKSMTALKRANPVTSRRGLLGPIAKFIPQVGYKANCAIIKGRIDRVIQKQLSVKKLVKEGGPDHGLRQQILLDRVLADTEDPLAVDNTVTSMMMANESMSRPLSPTL